MRARDTLAVKILLPALLLVLLVTQAASSVCGAQCIQHQLPASSVGNAHAMVHCHSMLQPPQANGAALQTCPDPAHSFCAIDLLANIRGTNVGSLLIHADRRTDALLHNPSIASLTPANPSPRSSAGFSLLITALRV